MHIVYFFTYGYSLESWNSAGILDRELKIFDKLIEKYNLKFTLVTYGDEREYDFNLNENIKVLPIYTLIKKSPGKFINLIKTFFISKLILNKVPDCDVIKQNQLLGSWIPILCKLKTKKPLYIRTGYDMFLFSIKEKKSIFKILSYYLLTQITLFFSNLYSITSKEDKLFLTKYFLTGKKKLIIRPNWVENYNTKDFLERKSKSLLAVGRFEKQKNYKHLIESLAGTEFSLDIVGSGSEKEELEKLSRDLSVQVNFLGILKNEELLKLYTEYKYFVSSSEYEGNPKAILEAMSSGCVVIARAISNNKEIITDLDNGFLFNEDKNSLNQILDKIKTLNNEKLNEISLKAVNFTKKHNSLDGLSDNIYSDFLSLEK